MHEERVTKTTSWARLVAVLLALSLVAAACGGSEDESSVATNDDTTSDDSSSDDSSSDDSDDSDAGASGGDIETLEIMSRWTEGGTEAAAFDAALAEFTSRTGIEVDVVSAAENLDVTYETALAAGQEPHFVAINLFDKSIAWLDSGATVEVGRYIEDWGLTDVVDPATVAEWTNADGAVQGFPYSGFAWPVWYNTALLEEAGVAVPNSIEELKAAAVALEANGVAPVVVGGSDWSGQKLFVQIMQSYLQPSETQALLGAGGFCANPAAMSGIELFSDLLDSGVFISDVEGYSADLMNETFYSGEAAIMPAGSWAFDAAPDELRANIQLGGFPLPDGAAFDAPTRYQGFTGVGFMISPRGESEALGAIEELVKIMYEEEFYATFVSDANLVPTIQLEDPSVATNPLLQAALGTDYNSGTSIALLPDVHVPASANDGIGQAIALAYAGGSPADVCSAMDSSY